MVAADVVELAARHRRGDVQLAAAPALILGILIGLRDEAHLVETRRGIVPVVAVALEVELRALHPGNQTEGAVADEIARLDEAGAVAGEARPVHGHRRPVRHQAREVGRRAGELDDQGRGIRRRDTERRRRQAAGDDLGGVADRLDDLCVLRARGRIDQAAQCRDEIRGDDRIAVRPARLRPQHEGPAQAIGADRPGRRDAGCRRAVAADDGQAFVEIAQHVRRLDVAGRAADRANRARGRCRAPAATSRVQRKPPCPRRPAARQIRGKSRP
jgi:hypothetical protein